MLDHTAFPTIMDTILQHASAKVLLSVRGTSKHFRSVVDAMLFTHVALRMKYTPPAYTVPWSAAEDVPFHPSRARILDIHGGLHRTSSTIAKFDHLRIVRVLGSRYPEGFASLGPNACGTVVEYLACPADVKHFQNHYVFETHATHFVRHLMFDETSKAAGSYWTLSSLKLCSSAPVQVDLVLWPVRRDTSKRPEGGDLRFLVTSILQILKDHATSPPRITIVAMEDVDDCQRWKEGLRRPVGQRALA